MQTIFTDFKDRTPTILVVEDEFLIRAMLSDYLQGCGFKVLRDQPLTRPSQSSRT